MSLFILSLGVLVGWASLLMVPWVLTGNPDPFASAAGNFAILFYLVVLWFWGGIKWLQLLTAHPCKTEMARKKHSIFTNETVGNGRLSWLGVRNSGSHDDDSRDSLLFQFLIDGTILDRGSRFLRPSGFVFPFLFCGN